MTAVQTSGLERKGSMRAFDAHPRPDSSGDPPNALACPEGRSHARGPASDVPTGLSEAIEGGDPEVTKTGLVFAPVPTPGRPPARCPLSGGPPRVWPYAPRRVVPDAFVLRQLVRRGCLCLLTRPSLVAKPTRRIESAFVGVYGRLKIFEFRVVGLFTQPAANENPYPMKGLLAFATRFPRSNRLGSIRRVNWSSRLALQTFETAPPTLTLRQVLSCRHVFVSSQTKRTPPRPVARIMGWFGTDDTPADAGSPVDKDTYVVTYCRN